MGALQVGDRILPPKGKFRLKGNITDENGNVVIREATFVTSTIELLNANNQPVGRLLMGYPKGDILLIDGVEVGIGQRNDPGKLRFFGYYDDGTTGARFAGGGVISWNVLRPDGIMEEIVMLNAGSKDHPHDYTGMFRVLMRASNDQENWKVAQVIEAGEGSYYTGLGNFLGWLGKHANAGEQPRSPGGGVVVRFWSDTGRFCYNVQGDPTIEYPFGRIVQYDTWDANGAPIVDESQWTAVAIIRPEKLK